MQRRTALLGGILAASGTGAALRDAHASRLPLVTQQEAGVPPPPEPPVATRAVTRGPGLRIVSPPGSPASVTGPFWLRIEFVGRGGARPDPATLRVRYLRTWAIDITERLRPFVTAEAIEVREAELPSGTHHFTVEIDDNQGRRGAALIEFRKL